MRVVSLALEEPANASRYDVTPEVGRLSCRMTQQTANVTRMMMNVSINILAMMLWGAATEWGGEGGINRGGGDGAASPVATITRVNVMVALPVRLAEMAMATMACVARLQNTMASHVHDRRTRIPSSRSPARAEWACGPPESSATIFTRTP